MRVKFIGLILLTWCLTTACAQITAHTPTAAKSNRKEGFFQEYHEAYPIGKSSVENNVRSIAVDKSSNVFITTEAGVFEKSSGASTWTELPFQEEDKGPAYAVATDGNGTLWIGNWNGVFTFHHNLLTKMPGTTGPVSLICVAKEGVYALGPQGVWLNTGNQFLLKNYPVARSVRGVVSDGKAGLWITSDAGLYHVTEKATHHFYKTDILLSAELKGLAFDEKESLWITGLGGVSVISNGKRQAAITPADGCPSIYTSCVKRSPDKVMWIGTKVGVIRFYPGGKHSLLFSRRWLINDQVNDIVFDQEGSAWIATANGVSVIKKRWITLAQKQDYFYGVQMARHIREPWISGQCRMAVAGDTAHCSPEDDDNDGEYTGNYLAMESFRFAVTKSEDAREKAKKAFHFLKELKDITGGDGYFARTIVPIGWAAKVHDTNRLYTARERAEELVNEPRFKPVETRWHKSADGQWLWKGDASSDEWCGHMMGYYFYYQLAANKEEKALIRQHVASLVDHLIAHNYTMMDTDGSHTRWGVWSPALLNRDPEWQLDRSENSMELLAFLKLAYYCTDNEKYQQHYLQLVSKEHYLDNMAALTEQNPAWFIYFDVTMQAYLFPILIRCENDQRLRAFYQQLMDKWMEQRKGDHNPLINFLYCYARDKKAEQQASLDFLINTPLDLTDWHIDHTKREDVHMVHTPVLNELQVSELPPPEIRNTVRWDNNPWSATGGSDMVEREPVFWLYPYWMGRYLNMID
ncbi:hypothetical protein QWZ08_27490 [Ferruginibacter paludis]|uniref:ligand-binding sensor domain-containing protein n=1 Tax=Ferruginibacter paludis TaxID=1310417 RepID=UPI0025B2A586|nr:hypothetical protein [Ferruginibacter paludis]MDN3659420.1 hypothetical protein [Ferruginibacter paludis]